MFAFNLFEIITINVSYFALFVFIFVTILVACWIGLLNLTLAPELDLPGPKPLSFLGNLLDIRRRGGIHKALLEYTREYGKHFVIYQGRIPSVVIVDPETLRQVLVKNFTTFRNRFPPFSPPPPLDSGLFFAKDQKWKRIRTTITPSFSAFKIKQMMPLIEEACEVMVKKLRKDVANTCRSIDITSWFKRLTLDIILSTAFGVTTDLQTNPRDELAQKVRDVLRTPEVLRPLLVLPFGSFLQKIVGRFIRNPFSFLQDMVKDIIKIRREQEGQGNKVRNDLLQSMLNATAETGHNGKGIPKLTDEEVIAQSIVSLVAGHDTSSNTLSFVAYYLALYPEIQNKLRQEVTAALRSNPNSSLYDIVQGLEYLQCVISETQRLNPASHFFSRQSAIPCVVNGISIPAGVEILIPVYALHHDSDLWHNPEKFDPERHRGSAKEKQHPYQFLPFGAGPRTCIGMRFALLEIKIALCKLLTNFEIERCDETRVPLKLESLATLTVPDGIHLRLKTLI